jgi:hypothetical protein
MFGFSVQAILGLTVIGTAVSILGNLLVLFLKEIWLARSFEGWKAQRALKEAYRQYQLPISIAATELSDRLYHLAREDNPLREERNCDLKIIGEVPARRESAAADKHYYRYRFMSNVYRLCCLLGWIELYRCAIGTLNPESSDKNRHLEMCLEKMRSVLADGWINENKNWKEWRDCLVFREELRAIGHRMISDKAGLSLIDFGTFSEIIENDLEGKGDAKWFIKVAHFFEGLGDRKDFRLVRMKMLVVHLSDLTQFLQPKGIDAERAAAVTAWRSSFDTLAGGQFWRKIGDQKPKSTWF